MGDDWQHIDLSVLLRLLIRFSSSKERESDGAGGKERREKEKGGKEKAKRRLDEKRKVKDKTHFTLRLNIFFKHPLENKIHNDRCLEKKKKKSSSYEHNQDLETSHQWSGS